jgi:hypothetical protein
MSAKIRKKGGTRYRIQARERLIKEQDFRIDREDDCQGDFDLLPDG